jgi:hypothetical protein
LAAACLFNAAPASAGIALKAGCDGRWVARASSGFATSMGCERPAAARPKLGALRMRAHGRWNLAHARVHKRSAAHGVPRELAAPIEVAAAPRRESECVNLNCPQFILIGIGY